MTATVETSVRQRSPWRKATDTFAAYLRLDIIEERMFPLSTGMRYLAVVVPVFLYYFQAEFLGTQADYAATLIGISVAAGLWDALSGFTGRLMFAQERGILETYLVEPVSWKLIPLAMNLWRSASGIFLGVIMMVVGWALGADMEMAKFPLFFVILALGVVACNAVGIFAASFLVLFKRGEPVITLYGMVAAILGGTLFSITVLPNWIQWMSYLVPHAYVISAARDVMIEGSQDGGMSTAAALGALVAFSAIAFPVGLRVFNRSLEFARKQGLLGT